MEEEQSLVTPGQVLGAVGEYKAGPGTFVKGPSIIASVVGFKRISEERTEDEVSFSKTKDLRSILVFFFCLILLRLTIEKKKELPVLLVTKEKEPAVVPQIGSVVTAKVIRVNPRFASVDILCVGSKALKETFRGIIRTQDVRATEVDKVEIYKSFRPGDIVRAEVISLGDSRSYYLSTAKNELGVVFATSMAGSTMIPISWNQMQCPKTKVVESRKVAKVV
ncbi:Exosome complex component CSL4, variant 2 [Balamuthia mandrillaris]